MIENNIEKKTKKEYNQDDSFIFHHHNCVRHRHCGTKK